VTAANASDGGARFLVTLPLRPTVRLADDPVQATDIN
jgi:hypothetical protein